MTLKESDYFKVRVPNAIEPQKQTVSAPVQVSLKFEHFCSCILTMF